MRLIDADALQYRRKDYGGHDDVSNEERTKGIMYLLKEDIDNAPTEPDTLLAEIIKIEKERNYWEETARSFERTINKLEKAISVERHGKWIPRIATGNIALIECSECQFHYPEVLGTFSFYYCPYCGAKMDKGENGDRLN